MKEQARVFHDADVVVASHGSGLANLVFCRSGARVVELFRLNYVNVMHWTLANQVSLAYGYVIGSDASASAKHQGRRVHEDMTIDVARVEDLLARLGVD